MIPLSDNRYSKISLDELQTPKEGADIIMNSWWETIGEEALLWKPYGPKSKWVVPQCNKNPSITDRLKHKECNSTFIPVAYLITYKDR